MSLREEEDFGLEYMYVLVSEPSFFFVFLSSTNDLGTDFVG